ncbi:MAG: hypothetical protein NTZ87_03480 [Candidatus Nomurabacteria bacterium]|nr:hypothetical protein [Candidatus Nomurabacteria bacterium]
MDSETKICQSCKKDFVIEPDDFGFYEKIKVPPPTFCPECRMIRKMFWRNERVLHKAICGLCKKSVISMYDPKNISVIFCDKCWWGDGWDSMDYGISYDFSQPFFLQWIKLFKQVPLIQAWRFNNVNSDYINYSTECRNGYLSSSVTFCENIYYSFAIDKSQDIADSSFVTKSNLCYENIDSLNNYNGIFLQDCSNCIDSGFLFDCINCHNCFLSSNLRNKKYVLRNNQYSETEYKEEISKIRTDSFRVLRELFSEFTRIKEKNSIYKYIQAVNVVKCSGNNIINSKNSINSFGVFNSENIKNTFRMADCKDCMDVFSAIKTELAYESAAPDFNGSDAQFCVTNQTSHDIRYSSLCSFSSHLFACIGLKSKHYCILNKQYTKEQYEELVPKIIKHMNDMPYISTRKNPSTGSGQVYKYGEFFPSELSPFSYNETIAQEYFPLTKEEALNQGYSWKDREERNYKIDIKTKDIPDNIKDINDEIINKVIECEHQGKCNEQCTEAFKIIPSELQFYKRMNLPIPHLCPNCRHYERLKQRNPLKLWHRKCMKEGCENEFETSYSPERPEIVYCERCYQQEVY